MSYASYRNLKVWQKSMTAATGIYTLVKYLPREETYALSDQMRRAAISIASNIAEGAERNSPAEFSRFLHIAQGSRAELETQLLLCTQIGYLTQEQIHDVMELLSEIAKMLTALIIKFKR